MLSKLLSGLRSLVGGGQDKDWDYSDRRELIRLRCHYDVEFAVKGKKHKGQVVDMSLKGMKLRGFVPAKVGDIVEVSNPREILDSSVNTIKCKVLWCRKRERDFVVFLGVAYAESDQVMSRSWIKSILRELGFDSQKIFQKRKFVRAECFIPANLVYGHGKSVEGQVYNLGVGGTLIECRKPFDVGTMVEARIGPLEDLDEFSITGKVVQVTQQGPLYMHGIEFTTIKQNTLDALSKYLIFLLQSAWVD